MDELFWRGHHGCGIYLRLSLDMSIEAFPFDRDWKNFGDDMGYDLIADLRR